MVTCAPSSEIHRRAVRVLSKVAAAQGERKTLYVSNGDRGCDNLRLSKQSSPPSASCDGPGTVHGDVLQSQNAASFQHQGGDGKGIASEVTKL